MPREGGTEIVVVSASEAETDRLGSRIAQMVGPGTVIGLVGPLGAGKTRLSRAIAQALGAAPEAIASPTFVLVHEYVARVPVYHFDTYRLRSPEEFEALGVEEYFAGDGVCLVEWADRVEQLLPDTAWWVVVELIGDRRRFRLRMGPDAAKRWGQLGAQPPGAGDEES